ncbi:hypothetical protein [Paenibacillus eucommiae]|uniref:Uncharacterized protein n=1 Tax=Paenibacillus eucommiae TaxID=1355755 RepID=A0ABS4IV30_9BACL|nr:hypothetical protein [Paenibacillus eucommiae]MBP1991446.1 hypothetical protein [Paenibacillus eucommiae]
MIFIVKARLWRGPVLLTMKIIVKVADTLGCERWREHSSVPAAWPAGRWEIPSDREKKPCLQSV